MLVLNIVLQNMNRIKNMNLFVYQCVEHGIFVSTLKMIIQHVTSFTEQHNRQNQRSPVIQRPRLCFSECVVHTVKKTPVHRQVKGHYRDRQNSTFR